MARLPRVETNTTVVVKGQMALDRPFWPRWTAGLAEQGGIHVCAARPNAANPEEPMTQQTSDLALATRGLRKRYGSRLALAGLDLSVPSGVVYGFLGPNGAGKTTTMRLLTGLIHPDSGTIEVLGRPFGRGDRRRLFDVGALIEAPSFYPFLSGRQNLIELAASGAPVSAGRIDELLELTGLREREKDKVQGYSLGMKQRLGIAAALLSDPKLLLLDEPSNGLDPAGIVAMRETLRNLSAIGKTVFISSHQLGEIQLMVDVVGIISAGRLVREGPIEELLTAEGTVRVRVRPDEVERALVLLAGFARPVPPSASAAEPGWIAVRTTSDRTAEITRTLGLGGIWALGLEAGNDLEMLFLELTGGVPIAGAQGAFFGVAGGQAGVPPSVGEIAA